MQVSRYLTLSVMAPILMAGAANVQVRGWRPASPHCDNFLENSAS
jgi:hypothetical protein